MALMTAQAISNVIEPTFSAVNSSDTITAGSGLVLYVKVGATTTEVTVVVPGTQSYSGVAATDLIVAGLQNEERAFYIPTTIADSSTGLVTVSYDQTTDVTSALLKV
jgi:hypothetical protein